MLIVLGMLLGEAVRAGEFTLLSHPSLAGLITSDPYLGNADDELFPGINTFGGASQYLGSTGIYGFLGGTISTRGLTAFGPHPQQIFGMNEFVSVDMFGEWNFNPASLFNQPHTQSLDAGSPAVSMISPNQTYTTSFVLYDDGYAGHMQFNGTGRYLLNGQLASDLYTGDVLTHFNTVTPLLPTDWQGVAQESQTWSVLDGPNVGITGFTTSTFFTTDTAAIPTEPPAPLGAPWVTSGFVASSGGSIQVGGEVHLFSGLGGPGTAELSGGNVVGGKSYVVGTIGADSGHLLLRGPGTASVDGAGGSVVNGSIDVNDGATLEVSAPGSGSWLWGVFPEASIVVDGPGSEMRVHGGTMDALGIPVAGVELMNFAAVLSGASAQVSNGAKLIAEGENSSAIGIGGLDLSAAFAGAPLGTDELSILVVDGTDSLIDGGSLIFVGTHPDVLVLGESFADPGLLEVRNGATARADTIYIAADGTVTGADGTLEGTVENHGTVIPGNSPGTLDVVGDYIQGADGLLVIEIGSTDPGMFDVLNVSGSATLGGTLRLELIGGFTPGATDTFDFLTADNIAGDFDDYLFPTFGDGRTFVVTMGASGITAGVAPIPLPGAIWLFAPAIAGLVSRWRNAAC